MQVLNIGSLNLDHVYAVEHFVRAGETISASTYNTFLGGKGFNQSVALAKANAKVSHAGLVGKDGSPIITYLEELGIDTTHIRYVKESTGHALIQVDQQGQNSIIVYAGANGCADYEFVDSVLHDFSSGDTVILQNEISCVSYIMECAKAKGLRVVFNPSPATAGVLDYPLSLVDIFVLNESEGQVLTGEICPDRMLDVMRKRYPKAEVILTLGNEGSIFQNADTLLRQDIVDCSVVDTTAAGDTFTGYFLSWYLNGKSPKKSLYAAAIASSLAVSRPGAAASIPSVSEVLEWWDKHNINPSCAI